MQDVKAWKFQEKNLSGSMSSLDLRKFREIDGTFVPCDESLNWAGRFVCIHGAARRKGHI